MRATNHAIKRYQERCRDCSYGYAANQLRKIAKVAEVGGVGKDGLTRAVVGDLTLILDRNTIVTCY